MTMNTLEKLRERNEHLNYLKEFDKEVQNNSDRGLTLICGSIIDQLLNDVLKSFLIKKDSIDKNIFSTKQPLGTFDSKLKMSFYLGLITDAERSNIVYIQRIRNRFAHEITDISFSNQAIENICSHFIIPKNSYLPSKIPYPEKGTDYLPYVDLNPIKEDTSAKDRFIFTFKYLYTNLVNRTYVDDIGSREEYTKQDTAVESLISMRNKFNKLLAEKRSLIKTVNDLRIEIEELSKKETGKSEEDIFDIDKQIRLHQEEYELDIKEFEQMEKDYKPMSRDLDYAQSVIKNSLEE